MRGVRNPHRHKQSEFISLTNYCKHNIYIYMYMYVCIYIYICMYIYIYIYIPSDQSTLRTRPKKLSEAYAARFRGVIPARAGERSRGYYHNNDYYHHYHYPTIIIAIIIIIITITVV